MKRLITLLALAGVVLHAPAQTTEYLQQKEFQSEKKKIYENLRAAGKQVGDLKKADVTLLSFIDSLGKVAVAQSKQLAATQDSLNRAQLKISDLELQVTSRRPVAPATRAVMIIVAGVALVLLFYLLLRHSKKLASLERAIEDLDKKTTGRIDTGLAGLREETGRLDRRIGDLGADLKTTIRAGLDETAEKSERMELRVREEVAGLSGRMDASADEMAGMKKGLGETRINLEKRLEEMQREAEKTSLALGDRLKALESPGGGDR